MNRTNKTNLRLWKWSRPNRLLPSPSLQVLIIALVVCISPTTNQAALGKLGVMGDSLTDDEYWVNNPAAYTTNWPGLLLLYRGLDMGPTAEQAGTNTWGEPRGRGYKFNWARGGATSATLLSQGQHTGLAGQATSDGVLTAVLAIGSNDFNPGMGSSNAYLSIYYDLWSSSQIEAFMDQALTNIETALATVRTAGISVVLATPLDTGVTPAVVSALPDAASRARVSTVIQSVNAGLKKLAQKYQVPLVDWYGLFTAMLGPTTNLYSTLKVGNVDLNLRGSDPGPPNSSPTNVFVYDSFHPGTVLHGILANALLQAFDRGCGSGLALFSEEEILSFALIPYGGSDTLLSRIGSYTNYVFLPTLPKFTTIAVAGTNVALSFSTVSNQQYLIESRNELTVGSWETVTNAVPGSGSIVTVTNHTSQGGLSRFYRVRQLP